MKSKMRMKALRMPSDVCELLERTSERSGIPQAQILSDSIKLYCRQDWMLDFQSKREEAVLPKSAAPDPQLDLFDAEEPLCRINGIEGVRGSTPRGSTSQSREVARKLIDLSGVRIEVLSEESRGRHCRGGGGELHFAQAA